ncbi:MAG: hypothetical protein RBT78_02605 [Kiritimatiellia bacterium]|jgi:hypothetical protein|nr:hypothetical protein [Kiritimatiellia bacterium]
MRNTRRVSNGYDLTGEGFPVVQETPERQPTYHPADALRHPYVAFNGSNVLCTAEAFVCYSNHTVFAVAKADGLTYDGNDLFGGGDWSPGTVVILSSLRNDYRGIYFKEDSYQYALVNSAGAASLAPAVYGMWMDDAELRLCRDGLPHGSAAFAGPRTNLLKRVSLGYRLNGSPNGLGLIGRISEVLVYDRALADGERQQIGVYLYEKWIMPRKGTILSLR